MPRFNPMRSAGVLSVWILSLVGLILLSACDSAVEAPDDQLRIIVRQRTADGSTQVVGEARSTQAVGGVSLGVVAAQPVSIASGPVELSVDAGGTDDVPVFVAYTPSFGGTPVDLVVSSGSAPRVLSSGGLEGSVRVYRIDDVGATASDVRLRLVGATDTLDVRVDDVLTVDPGVELWGDDLTPISDATFTEVAFRTSDLNAPALAVVRYAPDAYDVERLPSGSSARWEPGRSRIDGAAFCAQLYVLTDRRGRRERG